MTGAIQTAGPSGKAANPQRIVGEWFWRFLAVAMVVTVGWVLWIIYQINPQPLITKAGLEAAAKARASQDAKGKITQLAARIAAPPRGAPSAGDSLKQAPPAQAEAANAPLQAPAAAPKGPPVNMERLRFAESIETPIPGFGDKK